jgi:Helix-turn-helix domain
MPGNMIGRIHNVNTPEAQMKAEAEALRLEAEMDLAEVRRALKLSQAEIGQTLQIGQGSVAKIENRADMYVSTLRRFIEADGRRVGNRRTIRRSFGEDQEFCRSVRKGPHLNRRRNRRSQVIQKSPIRRPTVIFAGPKRIEDNGAETGDVAIMARHERQATDACNCACMQQITHSNWDPSERNRHAMALWPNGAFGGASGDPPRLGGDRGNQMNSIPTALNPTLAELAGFSGLQLKLAMGHLSAHGMARTALGTTVTGWWNSRYQTHVLQTDDPAFVETMAMNWLVSDHKKSKFVGIVMDGNITVEGKTHDALILRSRTADHAIRLMAFNPYYKQSNKDEPWLTPFVDFPADQAVPPDARDAVLEILLKTLLGKRPL